MADRVYLVGMMGAGKSTVGPIVAHDLGWSFLETDAEVERSTGSSIPELFASGGEALFRREESRVLSEVQEISRAVVSVGGGAVLDRRNRAVLVGTGFVVWLRAKPETLAERIGDVSTRPLLAQSGGDPLAALTRIEAERRSLYSETADAVVEVDGSTAPEVAHTVVDLVRDAAGSRQMSGGSRG